MARRSLDGQAISRSVRPDLGPRQTELSWKAHRYYGYSTSTRLRNSIPKLWLFGGFSRACSVKSKAKRLKARGPWVSDVVRCEWVSAERGLEKLTRSAS